MREQVRKRFLTSWRRALRSARQERGQALVLVAGGLVAFMGLVALSVDVGHIVWARTDQQKAADAAALAVANAYLESGSESTARAVGFAYADQNGYESSFVTVNRPPTQGDWTNDPNAFEVIISRSLPKFFVGVLYEGEWKASARAVTRIYEEARGFGVITLHPTACNSLIVNGDLRVENGGAFVNSNCEPNALYVGTGGVVETDLTHVTGTYEAGSGAVLDPKPVIHQPPVPDPYETVPVPPKTTIVPPPADKAGGGTQADCEASEYKGDWTFYPGRYECPVTLAANSTATFKTGDYLFEGGFRLNNGSQAVWERGIYVTEDGLNLASGTMLKEPTSAPTGVLIYNTCATPCGTAGKIDLHSTASVQLTPYGDPYENILIFQDRAAAQQITFNADSFTKPGAIYAKEGHLEFSAGTNVPLQFVSGTAAINSSATIDVDVFDGHTVMVKFAEFVE